jgi:hypothetical protein
MPAMRCSPGLTLGGWVVDTVDRVAALSTVIVEVVLVFLQ